MFWPRVAAPRVWFNFPRISFPSDIWLSYCQSLGRLWLLLKLEPSPPLCAAWMQVQCWQKTNTWCQEDVKLCMEEGGGWYQAPSTQLYTALQSSKHSPDLIRTPHTPLTHYNTSFTEVKIASTTRGSCDTKKVRWLLYCNLLTLHTNTNTYYRYPDILAGCSTCPPSAPGLSGYIKHRGLGWGPRDHWPLTRGRTNHPGHSQVIHAAVITFLSTHLPTEVLVQMKNISILYEMILEGDRW